MRNLVLRSKFETVLKERKAGKMTKVEKIIIIKERR